MSTIDYIVEPDVSDEALNNLFAVSWEKHVPRTFRAVLAHSLTYVCAFDSSRLVGFVNVAWDGGIHGFLFDTTVHPAYQRKGIGTALIRRAAAVAKERSLEWLHVDYEPHLEAFYRGCGFQKTAAGLMELPKIEL